LCGTGAMKVRAARIAAWLGVLLALTIVCLLPVVLSANEQQLLGSHVGAAAVPHKYGKALFAFFKKDIVLFCLALWGVISLFESRSALKVTFASWLILAVIIYYWHHPVWSHHVTMLSIPACAMIGIGVDTIYRLLQRCRVKRIIAVMGCFAMVFASAFYSAYVPGHKGKRLVAPWHYSVDREDYAALSVIGKKRGKERTMIASRPMFIFRSKSFTPPSIAVATDKRFVSGLIDAKDIIKEVRSFQPKVVVVSKKWKRKVVKEIEKMLQGRYDVVYDKYHNHRRSVRVYVRKSAADNLNSPGRIRVPQIP
jgi:hypothetical protein